TYRWCACWPAAPAGAVHAGRPSGGARGASSCAPVPEGIAYAIGDVAHQAWRRLQVPVGVGHVRVAEVSREGEHVLGDALPTFRAGFERAHRKGVADVVDARSVTVGLLDVGDFEHLLEHGTNAVVGEAATAKANEEARRRLRRAASLDVSGESLSRSLVQRDEARLLELGPADQQPLRLHVVEVERERLRDPKARREHQGEEG